MTVHFGLNYLACFHTRSPAQRTKIFRKESWKKLKFQNVFAKNL